MNFLLFLGGCGGLIEEVIFDFNDKIIKNNFVLDINGMEFIIFIIVWVCFWDLVR